MRLSEERRFFDQGQSRAALNALDLFRMCIKNSDAVYRSSTSELRSEPAIFDPFCGGGSISLNPNLFPDHVVAISEVENSLPEATSEGLPRSHSLLYFDPPFHGGFCSGSIQHKIDIWIDLALKLDVVTQLTKCTIIEVPKSQQQYLFRLCLYSNLEMTSLKNSATDGGEMSEGSNRILLAIAPKNAANSSGILQHAPTLSSSASEGEYFEGLNWMEEISNEFELFSKEIEKEISFIAQCRF